MVTIIPRAEERLQIRPLADVRREERAPNTGGAVAEAQYKLGRTVASEALSFGELAIRKQEQVDRIELAKIKALRDSELKSVLLEEERNPDYEGMDGRITSRMKKYDDDLRKGVNGRLLKYVDPMIETEGAKLVPVLQGMYLKKQDDHASATALEAINQFIQNNDWASADATVDGMTWIDESKRAELKINIVNKKKVYDMNVKAQELGPLLYKETKGNLGEALEEIRKNYKGQEEEFYVSHIKSYFVEEKQAITEKREEISDHVMDLVNNKKGPREIQTYISENKNILGPEDTFKLNDFVERVYKTGRHAVAPQRDKFADLVTWIQAKDDLSNGKYKNANEFMKDYGGLLPASTLKSLIGSAFYGKKNNSKDPFNKYNPLSTVGDMIKDYKIGMSPKEEQRFYGVFSDEIHSRMNEKKRELTPDEIEGVAKELLSKEVVKRDYNAGENLLMWLGADESYFSPDNVTEGYKYQTKAAFKEGVKYDANTETYYYRDTDGSLKGWTPDYKPELKPLEKRAIRDPDFYKEDKKKGSAASSAKPEAIGNR